VQSPLHRVVTERTSSLVEDSYVRLSRHLLLY